MKGGVTGIMAEEINAMFQMFVTFFWIVLIILLAYFGTKWYAKKAQINSQGKNIRVIERVVIAQDKYLVLIEINDKVQLLGVTNKEINVIDTFEPSLLKTPANAQAPVDFKTVFDKVMKSEKMPSAFRKAENMEESIDGNGDNSDE